VNRLLAVAMLFLACSSGSRALSPSQPVRHGDQASDLNRAIDPCTDFDEFANGAWRASNPIPAGQPRWNRRLAARDRNRGHLRQLLEELAAKTDWPAGSVERLLSDHYASCMDQARIDAAGLTPIAAQLEEIDRARTPGDLQRAIRHLHELGIAAPFGITGAFDVHEPLRFIANVTAGGIGLPDRSAYAKPEALEAYRLHVGRVLTLGGVKASAESVVALEARLAEVSLDGATAADPLKTDHLMSLAQLEQLAPHIEWKTFIREAGLPSGDLNVAEPTFLQRLDAELIATPMATWRAYLAWRLLDVASPWLSTPFVEESKQGELPPRALRCTELTEALFGDALGQKYVERYFPPAAKAKITEIAQSLLAELKEEVRPLTWMTPETKRKALEKLASYDLQLGFPVAWKRYSSVVVRRDTFWANVVAGRRFNVEEDRHRIGKPTSREVWQLPATSPLAYIDLQLNQIALPAGYLQSPIFSLEASDAQNYGAIGAAMAHDLTHAIDLLGAENDVAGRPQNWWSDADRAGFAAAARCVADQYDGYFIEPGVHLQGKKVLGEAVGDLAGVRLAWQALHRNPRREPGQTIDGLTEAQQFFVAYAQARGAAERLETQREMVTSDAHPVAKFRVLGPLANLESFQQAFACQAGAPMARPPEKRCSVW
jgi:putative endopeptidase